MVRTLGIVDAQRACSAAHASKRSMRYSALILRQITTFT
jgi:hypothetical protein